LVQSFFIPSISMQDTLLINDRVMVSKLAPGPFDVHRGDVVVFKDPPEGWLAGAPELPAESGIGAWFHGALQAIGLAPNSSEEFLIKRTIGVGGDTVECIIGEEDLNGNGVMDGKISVNGAVLEETYVKDGEPACEAPLDVVVPDGALWVMGDNRGHSGDSRVHDTGSLHGAIDLKLVVGVAKIRTWPLNRFALMRNPGAVFADVPDPQEEAR